MKNLILVLIFLALSGCVSYTYSGVKEKTPTSSVDVFQEQGKINKPYKVLGQGVASGSYQSVSYDKLIATLISEAKKCGANAILIVDKQVLPKGSRVNSSPHTTTQVSYDASNNSWNNLYMDVDQNIGNIGKKTNTEMGRTAADYVRVVKGEYLQYSKEK